jgi:hypothetical protein
MSPGRLARPILVYAALALTAILGGFVLGIPVVRDRVSWQISELRARIKYAINPPGQAIFIPEEQAQLEALVQATLQSLTQIAMLTPTPTNSSATATPTPTPTITPTPLPPYVYLEGVKYEHQHNRWNYCAPANLSMALTFWGWDGNRDVVGRYVKPSNKDKNVMPWELVDFVETQTEGMAALVRQGGNIDLIKRLVAGGFPIVAEKGYYEYDYQGVLGWLGHFQLVNGYDESKGVLIVQDTYIKDGQDHETTYNEFLDGWRSFNYLFLIVYPRQREAEVLSLLGPWASEEYAFNAALQVAQSEVASLSGVDQFLAAFNIGSSHVGLQQYIDAAYAYDYAFQLYANLPEDWMRPYRILWYQTGPYWAYFYSGRYQDVIDLANTTLYDTISEPVLEESFCWRGLAYQALGNQAQAIADWQKALQLHPGWTPALSQLQNAGALP